MVITGSPIGWSVVKSIPAKGKTYFDYTDKPVILSLENLWVNMPGETVRNVSLDVHKGETGIGGMVAKANSGIPNGAIGSSRRWCHHLRGQKIQLNNPRNFLDAGMAFVSEDRRGVGLLLDESLEWNIAFTAMQVQEKFLKKYLGGLIRWRDQQQIETETASYVKQLEIRCVSASKRPRNCPAVTSRKSAWPRRLPSTPSCSLSASLPEASTWGRRRWCCRH